MEKIGQRIKRLREEKGLSLKEVASKAGIPLSTYREWEYGREIKGEPYVKIASVLEVSLYTLLTGKVTEDRELLEEIRKIEDSCHKLRLLLRSFD